MSRPETAEPAAAAATQNAAAPAADYVRAVVRRSGTSFYWSMRLLPRPRREAMYALYAFCREVDDIADGSLAPAEKRQGLETWRRRIDALYAGRAESPTARALLPAVRTYELPKTEFEAIIDGMESDALQGLVAPSEAELKTYCRQVAGAVGRLSVHIFGDNSPTALRLADVQGEALQVTNILRDLAEDAGRGRLYLPRERLAAAGVPDEPVAALAHPGLPAVCESLAQQARQNFELARSLLDQCAPSCRRPCGVMLQFYSRLLERLVARGWRQPAPRLRLGQLEKLGIVLRHGIF